ncbi:MAG: hypothetical protein sL5_10110 [Candidatus Mesenet longicola]|uniref:Uncharacterized protein n=1 Tax=Candidatus Mesenet longicola TaxID=1892558 RepID=A0A8J3MPG4_9RICK|nr:MAG: hypothetical protein sGL2_02790 [Candidatus Mesenet longicola]GHM60018.1 MAG: hypothetical protein sL5_10110 [Candidatus Mesenet longicola]
MKENFAKKNSEKDKPSTELKSVTLGQKPSIGG